MAEAPSGPIVESYPVMRAAPMMMAMPMMAMPMMPMMGMQTVGVQQSRAVSYEEPAPVRSRGVEREKTCAGSQDRLDELDARVEALNARMKVILRTVELQTEILQELRDKGTIGNSKLPRDNS